VPTRERFYGRVEATQDVGEALEEAGLSIQPLRWRRLMYPRGRVTLLTSPDGSESAFMKFGYIYYPFADTSYPTLHVHAKGPRIVDLLRRRDDLYLQGRKWWHPR
jgi:hypothetical protein